MTWPDLIALSALVVAAYIGFVLTAACLLAFASADERGESEGG